MGKSGGGSSTSIQDVPPEFKPSYFRLFNSAFGAAQQGAGSPFSGPIQTPSPFMGQGMGQQQFRFPQQQQFPQAFPQQGGAPQPQNAMEPPQGQQPGGPMPFPGQFPVQIPGMGGRIGSARGQTFPGRGPTETFDPSMGFNYLQGGGQVNPASVYTAGSSQVPLSGGPPIIGSPFPGPFTAPTTGIELESLMGREAVGRQLQGLGNPLLGLGQAQAMGSFLNPQSNPFFQSNIEASLQPALDYFQRGVAPQLASQAIQSGAFKGSSARDFALGNVANDFGRNLLQTAAQQGMQNYLQERQIQQQTPQLLQQAAGLSQLSPEILAQVGAGQRELLQRPLDEALLRFQEFQQAPFRPLGPLASIIQGTNIGTTQQITPPRPSPLASGIAGGLGGGALGLTLADQLGLGAGGSAGLGGLGALLGGLGGGLG